MRGQLESDPPCVMSFRVPVQQWEIGRASSLHKGCSDRSSGHTPPKLKLGRSGPFQGENK